MNVAPKGGSYSRDAITGELTAKFQPGSPAEKTETAPAVAEPTKPVKKKVQPDGA